MDKHRRPYICTISSCSGVDFGDKAGLRRHEPEKHGNIKHPCPNTTCRRHVKGFSRKRNRDLRLKSCHKTPSRDLSNKSSVDLAVGSPQSRRSDEAGSVDEELGFGMEILDEKNSLLVKLQQREHEQNDLAVRQAEIEEDIRALRRAIQLVAS